MQGIVIKSTGSWFTVRNSDGHIYLCKLKGKFKLSGIKSTNPVAVGDVVDFNLIDENETGLIHAIHERKNYIVRRSTNLSKQSHIIAANIDLVLILATIIEPRTSFGFIDRLLVTAESYHIPALIVLNKTDIYTAEVSEFHQHIENIYTSAGYPVIGISSKTGYHLEELKNKLAHKTTLITGHSGVGKSTLINKIEPRLNLKTGDISSIHHKGKHTTTFAEMFELSFGGYVIDTPGVKEFGIFDQDKYELAHRFPEMRDYMLQCKFSNCTHLHEPGCAVKSALEEEKIYPSRYDSYLSILSAEMEAQK